VLHCPGENFQARRLWSVVEPRGADDHIDQFVLHLLRTGSMLCELVSGLIEEMPDDAYPGEEPAAVVIEMLCGTIRTSLQSADPCEVRRAIELIDQAGARTVEHLQIACELSRRIHGDDERTRRTYG
jgi:hypothetical protein